MLLRLAESAWTTFPALVAFLTQSVYGWPRAARWSNTSLGPDGPWNAVAVTMGGGQDVAIYAGKMWESFFLDSSYCENTVNAGRPCYAEKVGAIYDELAGTGEDPGIQFEPPAFFSDNMVAKGTQNQRYTDTLSLGTDNSSWDVTTVRDFNMVLTSDVQLQYPNGNECPLFAGCLSFGAAPGTINQTFIINPGTVAGGINTSLLAGNLFTQGSIASQSFGMHIGSVQPTKIPGSLWFGGYDRNRAVNDMLAVPLLDPYLAFDNAPLLDIGIHVVGGGSPFSWNTKTGLLASGNSSIGNRLYIAIDPCAPYLNLPKSTCDAIAAEIPVSYDEGLGLYLWKTNSPEYGRIVQSPSVLTFIFMDPDNNTREVNISIPFLHLNLTLDQPLVDKRTFYFPCNAASNGNYALGRAFLQDAFFGANLGTGLYFLSQAPGPNVAGQSISSIDEASRTIEASNNNWPLSWDGYWTPLPIQENPSAGPSPPSQLITDGPNLGLVIGLPVSVGVTALILAYAGFMAWRYRRYGRGITLCNLSLLKDRKPQESRTVVGIIDPRAKGEDRQPQLPVELPSTIWQLPAHISDYAAEMEVPRTIYEVSGDM